MTLEGPPPSDDGHNAPRPVWRYLADAAKPAIYGRSWVPCLRLMMLLAVLAVIVLGRH